MITIRPDIVLNVGYCFAGSTQAGLNTYALISSILRKLRTHNNLLPSLEDIAEACCNISLRHRNPIINNYIFKYAIFGYCMVHRRYECFSIEYLKSGDPIYECVDLENKNLIIGSHIQDIQELIQEYKSQNKNDELKLNRAPALVVKDKVKLNDNLKKQN